MTEQSASAAERPQLRSRDSEITQFTNEFRVFRREFSALREKKASCDKLIEVARQLENFLTDTSELAAAQQKDKSVDQDELVIQQARDIENVTVDKGGEWEKRVRRSSKTKNISVRNVYARLSGRATKTDGTWNYHAERKPIEPLSAEEQAGQAELQLQVQEKFKETLDSSFPQLEALLRQFYPDESEEKLRRRELLLLRGVGQYIRLERGSANRLRALGGIALPVENRWAEQKGDPRPSYRDGLVTKKMKSEFVDALIGYLVRTSPLCEQLSKDWDSYSFYLSDLKDLQATYDVESTVLMQSANVRKAEYRLWVTERAAEHPRVAGTPYDQDMIDDIHHAHQTSNRVAGVIAYGPPGTGKTEMIIEANRQLGFDTRIISMHRHSDFAQLMGEAPVFLKGLEANAGKTDRVAYFRALMENPAQLRETLSSRPDLFQKLLAFTPDTARKMRSAEKELSIDDVFDFFVEELKTAVNAQFVELFLSDGKDEDKDASWINGELQRAINDGAMALLDEGDKAPASAFDGISAVLSKQRGETFSLGGKEIKFPHWFHVDMSVNRNNLPEHMRDRFSVLKFSYPDAEDLLWKVGLMLSNEQGEIGVDLKTEWQVSLVFSYIVPRIHQLYEAEQAKYEERLQRDPDTQPEMRPFSMRGISTFCTKVRAGETVDRAIEQEILQPGKLADEGTEAYKAIKEIVLSLSQITDQLVFTDAQVDNPTGIERIVRSPIYGAIAGNESPHEIAKERTLQSTELTPDQRTSLEKADAVAEPTEKFRLPSGVLITQKQEESGVRLTYSYPLGNKTVPFFSHVYGIFREVPKIKSADQFGKRLVMSVGGEDKLITPFADAAANDDAVTDMASDIQLSSDGETSLSLNGMNLSIKRLELHQREALSFSLRGEALIVVKADLSADGKVAVIETADKNAYLVFIDREILRNADSETVDVSKFALPVNGVEDWRIDGNVVWSPNSTKSFVIS
jgi:MoxR-like ATPase